MRLPSTITFFSSPGSLSCFWDEHYLAEVGNGGRQCLHESISIHLPGLYPADPNRPTLDFLLQPGDGHRRVVIPYGALQTR